jgi:hypothetical protein
MRKVQIYVENQLIDLFEDESISVKSSVQNIQDIAKTFTDFSQSFTVPASSNNNSIFGFYYNNDLDTFDANTRVACRIEIDLIPFREGKLQLEGSIVRNNQVEAYKVNFYGDVVTLKDKFEEDKLRDLDYSTLSTVHNGATVQAAVESPSRLDVMFPLISSSRVWTYNDGTGIDDLTTYAIVWDELFPAITDSKILDLIESKYSVTFQGNFLTDDRFLNSFTWWKNRETTNFTAEAIDMEFNTGAASCTTDLPNAVGVSEVNLNYIHQNDLTQPGDWASWSPFGGTHRIQIYFIPATTVTYYIDVYKNGVFTGTTFSDNSNQLFDVVYQPNFFGLNDTYTFKARADSTLNFDFTVKYRYIKPYTNTSVIQSYYEQDCSYLTLNTTVSNDMDFSSAAPDIKVSDWFSGLLKQFNLTCYPVDTLTYQIEPLDDWYANGDTVDITEFVDTDEIEYDRAKMYNEISFEWEKSESILNVGYAGEHNKEYGELKEIFPNNDGGKYQVKLPFETLLFNNFDDVNNNLQVSYCLKDSPDYKPYIPKPVKLYLNEDRACEFFFNNGSTIPSITNYMPFGQSTQYNNDNWSINFGEEIDSLTNDPVSNSLYQTYYQQYLLNLFDSKTRKVTVKCIIPINILTRLSLDDAIIIRDKKYRINDMTTDLTTGVVQLVLLSDWVEDRGSRTPEPVVPSTGGTISVPIKPPRGGWIDIDNPVESKFITAVPTLPATNETDEQRLVITVPSNSTGSDRYQTIVYRGYYPDGSQAWERTIVVDQKGSPGFLLTESGGYLLQENLDKIQL